MENFFEINKKIFSKKNVTLFFAVACVLVFAGAIWYWTTKDMGVEPQKALIGDGGDQNEAIEEEEKAKEALLKKMADEEIIKVRARSLENVNLATDECTIFFSDNDFENPDRSFFSRINRDRQFADAYYGYVVAASVKNKNGSRCVEINNLIGDNKEGDCLLWYWLSRLLNERCSGEVKKAIQEDVALRFPKLYPGESVPNFVDAYCSAILEEDVSKCEAMDDNSTPRYTCRALAGNDVAPCARYSEGSAACENFYHVGRMILTDFTEDHMDKISSGTGQFFRMIARILKNTSGSLQEQTQSAWNAFCMDKGQRSIAPEFRQ